MKSLKNSGSTNPWNPGTILRCVARIAPHHHQSRSIKSPKINNPPGRRAAYRSKPGNFEISQSRESPKIAAFARVFLATGICAPIFGPSGRLFNNRNGDTYMPFDHLPATTCESPRPRREKLFREKRGIPLDREAKVRIMAYAKDYNAKHRREGQHQGPITWAFFRVLKAMLWGFHNNRTGYCFPSYESIAARQNAAGIPSMKLSKPWRRAASSIG